jgi:hypothetical protein
LPKRPADPGRHVTGEQEGTMSVNSLRSEITTREDASFQGKYKYGVAIAVLAAAVVLIGLGALMYSKVQEYRIAAESQRANEIANENQTVCEKWGQLKSPLLYAACSEDLDGVRARHERRINADQYGFGG